MANDQRDKIKYFIGIDISKYWFDFAVHTKGGKILSGQVENNPVGFKRFDKVLKDAKVPFTNRTLIIMEDAGQYDDKLVDFLSKKKIAAVFGTRLENKAFDGGG